jgi:hypothetical protein
MDAVISLTSFYGEVITFVFILSAKPDLGETLADRKLRSYF